MTSNRGKFTQGIIALQPFQSLVQLSTTEISILCNGGDGYLKKNLTKKIV